ncbi:Solute carrier family 49 member A3 [Manis javanica]|nr:Solute carrier family 49 member A3 [Manis javanica]
MNFSARLQQLPTVTHLAALQLADAQGQVVATIENKPGQTGSLAVYHALAALYGGSITPAAAELGLEWYAEHTQDAIAFPGKHPNIDRLLAWSKGRELPGPPDRGLARPDSAWVNTASQKLRGLGASADTPVSTQHALWRSNDMCLAASARKAFLPRRTQCCNPPCPQHAPRPAQLPTPVPCA